MFNMFNANPLNTLAVRGQLTLDLLTLGRQPGLGRSAWSGVDCTSKTSILQRQGYTVLLLDLI